MENMQALTHAQQRVLDHLIERQREGHEAPSLDELCSELGLASRGSLHKHITALIDAGLVAPMDGKQRGVRLTSTALDDGSVPLLGRIAAGRPIEAISGHERIAVPPHLRGRGECYALKVRGDSMIDAGILDGDTVLIEPRDSARNGEVVVALIDGENATLKRLYRRSGEIELHSENQSFPVQRYKPARVQIQGALVGLMRRY